MAFVKGINSYSRRGKYFYEKGINITTTNNRYQIFILNIKQMSSGNLPIFRNKYQDLINQVNESCKTIGIKTLTNDLFGN